MKCLYCGAQIPDDAALCPTCGSPVVGEDPSKPDELTAYRRRRCRRRRIALIAAIAIGSTAVAAGVAVATVLLVNKNQKRLKSLSIDMARHLLEQVDPQ